MKIMRAESETTCHPLGNKDRMTWIFCFQKWKFEQLWGVMHRHMWQTECCHTMTETTQMTVMNKFSNLYEFKYKLMNSHKNHFYSKKKRQVGISTRDQYRTCNRCCGCHPPPHHLCLWPIYLYTVQEELRIPSKNWDCTNSFLLHIVIPIYEISV